MKGAEYMKYNKKFKELLVKKNVSGYELSRKTGIPQSTISDWVSEKSDIIFAQFNNICEICYALNCDPKKFYWVFRHDYDIEFLFED